MDYIIKIYKDWKLHSEFTEIVSDMDDDYMFNEKQSIRESARSLKKYGSTCNHVRNNEILLKHEIDKTDTLQGIALKYGCTTEQIRRANRLFASDSLFLRQYLLIPVDKTSPYYASKDKDDQLQQQQQRPQSLPPIAVSTKMNAGQQRQSNNDTNINKNNNNNYNSSNNNSKSMDSIVMSPEEENKKCIDEFLGKIDSTIAESKKYVARSQHKSRNLITSQSDDDLFISGDDINQQRMHTSSSSTISAAATSNSNYQHHRHNSSGSTTDTAHLLNITQGKRVQNSLQRLEKQQDEFFEL